MDTPKIPKFRWGEISEKNSGHNLNEWGEPKRIDPKCIVAYRIQWKSQE